MSDNKQKDSFLYSLNRATADDIVHVSYGYGLFTGGLGAHTGAETIGATVVPVSTGNTQRQIQILRDFGCTAICCTPSYALYIAETLAKMGLGPEDIRRRSLEILDRVTAQAFRELETETKGSRFWVASIRSNAWKKSIWETSHRLGTILLK